MATKRTKSQNTSSAAGAVLTLLGLAGLAGWVDQAACPLRYPFGIPARIVLEALSPFFQSVWHELQPCLFGHVSVLECLLQVSVSSWQLVLTLAGVA